jgi:predicted KAP-like P-loop ATPase
VASNSDKTESMILTDDEAEIPILDFEDFSDTMVDIIKNSYPKFSIGIFGEWGTGKTTMMKQIQTKLKTDKSVICVWFDAWRYEREGSFALIPMLKTIAYSLPERKGFDGLRTSIKKGVGVIRNDLPKIASSVIADFAGKYVGKNTENLVNDLSNKLIPRLELLEEINEKDTVYFKGMNNIEIEL